MISIVARTRPRTAANPKPEITDNLGPLIRCPLPCALGLVVVLTGPFLSAGVARAIELRTPEIGASVVLQAEIYSGGDETQAGSENQFAVRQATIELSGRIGDFVEYDLEAGSSRCPASGTEFKVKDAGVFYKPFEQVRLGFMKGHIMRGFELYEECIEVLAAEKPRFAPVLAPCHPMGAVIDFTLDLEASIGIEGQLACLNGGGGTLESEHDVNLGAIIRTPLNGLRVGGYYNDVALSIGWDPITYETIYGDGFRAGAGADFQVDNVLCDQDRVLFRGEYYAGKGFAQGAGGSADSENPEEHEMTAFYVQGAYRIGTGVAGLPHVEPYVRYQQWDKGSNEPADEAYSYLTAGIVVGLGDERSFLRLDYETPASSPESSPEDVNRIIVRLQTHL